MALILLKTKNPFSATLNGLVVALAVFIMRPQAEIKSALMR
jgi:hypothetical protein